KRLTEEIASVNTRIDQVEKHFDKRLTEEITKINNRITQETSTLEKSIANLRADLIKWMFLFWIGQFAMLAGLLYVIKS
ncbi:DUF1640 domain-containing protein, partial [candidate division KSB1 bacterium]|nr:DUF1640 domain-containing protein [candidate division KSB1 bacterium]